MQDLIKYSIIATFQTKVWQQNTIFVYTSWDIVWTRPLLCGTLGLIREEMENLEIVPFIFFPSESLWDLSRQFLNTIYISRRMTESLSFPINHILFNFLPRFLHFPKSKGQETKSLFFCDILQLRSIWASEQNEEW